MSQGERKGSITTLRKWNLIAGGIDPMNDVIPASVGYGLEDALDFAMSEISRLEERIKRLEEAGDIMEWWCTDPQSIREWHKAKEAKP